ncbi:MAG TPA: hypothetical protein VHS05_09605 [Pyrinomonadaceae bacterium]|jgi:hypothetical protein|nr:hypothetical protein [Pyrinomonadaceae bacterium]
MEQAVEDAIAALLKAWSDQGYSREDLEVAEEGRTITVNVPDDHDNAYSIEFDEFVEIIDELKSAKIDAERGYIRTKYGSYQVVLPVGYLAEMADYHEINIAVTTENNITLSFGKNLFIVTFAAVSVGAHHEFYSPSTLSVISVTYPSPEDLLPEAEELKLIDAFLFELASTYDLLFSKVAMETSFDFSDEPFEKLVGGGSELKIRRLEEYNDGMRLYLAALQVSDPELRFLSLFKVLEFFAPVVFSLEENEAIRKKLDSPGVLMPDAEYIRSLIELVRSMEKRKIDKELMKALFITCLDVVELSKYLPASRRKALSYESKKVEIDAFSKELAETVVATRNQVAHAKSNYQPAANELRVDELPAFNEFLRVAAAQTIRWYNRLPEHQKLASA